MTVTPPDQKRNPGHNRPSAPGRPRTYDVVVVGAGPGGSTVAHHLARRGLDILLLDKGQFPRDKTCGDGLSPRAIPLLAEMGALDAILPHSHRVGSLAIHAPGGQSLTAPVPAGDGLPPYALVTPRLVLDDILRRKAIEAGAAFQDRTRVVEVEEGPGRVVVRALHAGRRATLQAQAVVIATGASLRLLERMGLLGEKPDLMLAARGYYEGVDGPDDRVAFRFDGVPLPGYGWVFPLGEGRANIGAGFFPDGLFPRRLPGNASQALEAFLSHPPVHAALRHARRAGPVKGFPLRVDFAQARTFGPRALLVGEAAGLVNPLTGEGIDNALESGVMAAQFLADSFALGDLSPARLTDYDARLRTRFQRQFVFCSWVRDWMMNPLMLDRLVRLAGRRSDLRTGLLKIALGYPDALQNFTARKVLAALLPGARRRG